MTNHSTNRTLLIAEYTLGVLDPTETAQAQRLLGSDPQAVTDALKWEQALLELTDRLPPAKLSDSLWEEIAQSLGMDADAIAAYPLPLRPEQPSAGTTNNPPQPLAPSHRTTRAAPAVVPSALPVPSTTPASTASSTASQPITTAPAAANTIPTQQADSAQTLSPAKPEGWYRQPKLIAWAVALLAIVTAAGLLISRTPAPPPVTVVQVAPTQAAILQAPGNSSTPGWVVTITPQGDVLLHPQVQTEVPQESSVQLWTYSLAQPEPRSLGLIDPNLPVTVPASLMGTIAPDQLFEMTQEPQGGSASPGPSGPVLFIGRVVTFGQIAPKPESATNNSTNL